VPSPCRGALEDPAEALVDSWESALTSGRVPDPQLAEAAAGAVARYSAFARLYPVCRPSALTLKERVDRLRGSSPTQENTHR
jgi:hypothetical protein